MAEGSGLAQAAGDVLELSTMQQLAGSCNIQFPTHTPAWQRALPPSPMPRPRQRSGPAALHRCRQRCLYQPLNPSPPPPAMPLELQPVRTPAPLPPVIGRSCEGAADTSLTAGPLHLCTCLYAQVVQQALPRGGRVQGEAASKGGGCGFWLLWHLIRSSMSLAQHAACWRLGTLKPTPAAVPSPKPCGPRATLLPALPWTSQ